METRVPTVADIVRDLEQTYPPSWARDWDQVGLVCGENDAPVRRVLFAVDPVTAVVDEALEWNADIIVTHHPLLLRGAHSVAAQTAKGRVLHRLIRSGCALFTAHTNADVAVPGVSDALARVLGLTHLQPLQPDTAEPMYKVVTGAPASAIENLIDAMHKAGAGKLGDYDRCAFTSTGTGTFVPGPHAEPFIGETGVRQTVDEQRLEMLVHAEHLPEVRAAIMAQHPYQTPPIDVYALSGWAGRRGVGRVGDLAAETTLREFAMLVAEALPGTSQGILVAGEPEATIRRVAVCGGAGDDLFPAVRGSGADVYVTSDLRHHPVLEAREDAGDRPPYLIDVPHWASEWPWLAGVANGVEGRMEDAGTPVEVRVSVRCTDPWILRIPSAGGIVR